MTILIYAIPILFIALGLPLATGRVKPNAIYGFRTRRTLSDPQAWAIMNRLGGQAVTVAGIVSLLFVIILPLVWDAPADDRLTVSLIVPIGLVFAAIAYAVKRSRERLDEAN